MSSLQRAQTTQRMEKTLETLTKEKFHLQMRVQQLERRLTETEHIVQTILESGLDQGGAWVCPFCHKLTAFSIDCFHCFASSGKNPRIALLQAQK